VAFSPDGKTLASAAADRPDSNLLLWDVAAGKARAVLKGHMQAASCVAFSPDGKMLASGSSDQTVLLWDLAALQKD
jgi:WD40 repeat protein